MPGPSGTRPLADAPAALSLNPNPIGERERRSEQHRPCQTDGTEQETESPQHHGVARVERPAPATQLGDDDRQRDGGDTERHPRPGRPRAIAVRAQITPYGRGGEQRQHQSRIDDRPARVQDGHSRHRGQHQARAKAANHQIGHCNSSFVNVRFRIRSAGCFRPVYWPTADTLVDPAAARPSTPKVAGSNGHQAASATSRQRRGRQEGRRPSGLDPLAVPLKQFPLRAAQAAQHHDLGAQPFHPGEGAFPVPGHAGIGWAASPVPAICRAASSLARISSASNRALRGWPSFPAASSWAAAGRNPANKRDVPIRRVSANDGFMGRTPCIGQR